MRAFPCLGPPRLICTLPVVLERLYLECMRRIIYTIIYQGFLHLYILRAPSSSLPSGRKLALLPYGGREEVNLKGYL